ncbi:N-acetylmuramoyl-L-alanine amidase family protein [Sphingobacterium lactis]|uniref:N-acetylmuramoyl-L-alanine amidase n=1 Tax=Sphingobacterium lactis TaxID=797291 RepID=A0A1H6B088_9SPHI|nr:N-acetylmuramoyl-L-alanine amidase [Sphingobacterium lactis]SEG53705.1 N-acetylmuramoyl-L-alanine amidase [Sphingobacterium lactis]
MKFNKTFKITATALGMLIPLLFLSTFVQSSNLNTPENQEQEEGKSNKAMKLIVIDPGHGGNLPGAKGEFTYEKDIVLQVGKKLKEAIEKEMPGVKAMLTRDSDIDVPFHQRTALANKNHADLFISIHCNSANSDRRVKGKNGRYVTQVIKRPEVSGTETFVCGFNRLQRGESDVAVRENADILMEDNYQENYGGFDPKDPSTYIIFSLMKRTYRDKSIRFATYIQNEYVKKGRPNRGVQELSLAVLASAAMPAVLTEIGFISNPQEEEFMASNKGQEEIVANIVDAIKHYRTSSGMQ